MKRRRWRIRQIGWRSGLVLAVLVALAIGLEPPSETGALEPLTRQMIYVIDGDTIDVDGARYRLVGYDTPETYRAECASEKAHGDAATRRLRTLVETAETIVLMRLNHRDRYGRGLAELHISDRNVAHQMIAAH